MRCPSNEVLAKRLLEARREGGYRVGSFLRRSSRRYLFLFVYFGAILIVLALMRYWVGLGIVLGMILGAFLRDIGWVRSTQRSWPFTDTIINWDVVEELANPEKP
jgi:hypothetical protein